jgi:hypothetical protein
MSVSQVTFGAVAVSCRSTRSSCTGGPALRVSPRFLANTDQIRCYEHSRAIRFSLTCKPRSRSSSAMNR